MQRTIIIVIISLLASGTLAGAYYYHESGRKDDVLDNRTREITVLNDRLSKLDEQMEKLEGERMEDHEQLEAIKDENPYIARLEKNLHEKDKEIKDAQAALEQCGSKRDAQAVDSGTEQKTVKTLKEKTAETAQTVQEDAQAEIDKRISALEKSRRYP